MEGSGAWRVVACPRRRISSVGSVLLRVAGVVTKKRVVGSVLSCASGGVVLGSKAGATVSKPDDLPGG